MAFLVDGTPLSSNGSSASTSSLSAGSHSVVASFTPSSPLLYLGGTGSATQTVGKANVTVTLSSSANPSVYGQAATITATVTAASPSVGTPTGTVAFSGSVAVSPSLSGGAAAVTIGSGAVGPATIQASYAGNANFNAATAAPLTQTVNKANTTVVLASSVNPSAADQAAALTATVVPTSPGAGLPSGSMKWTPSTNPTGWTTSLTGGKATSGARVPSGNVTWKPFFGTQYNSTKPLSASGTATFTSTVNKGGAYGASYEGSQLYNAATAAPVTVDVTKGSSTVALGASPGSAGVGDAVTLTASVSVAQIPLFGIGTGTVTFTDGGQAIGKPVVVTFTASGGKAVTTVSVTSPGEAHVPRLLLGHA